MSWSHITSKTKFRPLIKFFSNFDSEEHIQILAEEFGKSDSSVSAMSNLPNEATVSKNKLNYDSIDSERGSFCTNFGQ